MFFQTRLKRLQTAQFVRIYNICSTCDSFVPLASRHSCQYFFECFYLLLIGASATTASFTCFVLAHVHVLRISVVNAIDGHLIGAALNHSRCQQCACNHLQCIWRLGARLFPIVETDVCIPHSVAIHCFCLQWIFHPFIS